MGFKKIWRKKYNGNDIEILISAAGTEMPLEMDIDPVAYANKFSKFVNENNKLLHFNKNIIKVEDIWP